MAPASAMNSTDEIASDADDQVEPHSSANWTIDLVSSSMKPAPRKKKCHDQCGGACTSSGRAAPFPRRGSGREAHTANADTTSTSASAAR